jgi:hypothetical protein
MFVQVGAARHIIIPFHASYTGKYDRKVFVKYDETHQFTIRISEDLQDISYSAAPHSNTMSEEIYNNQCAPEYFEENLIKFLQRKIDDLKPGL